MLLLCHRTNESTNKKRHKLFCYNSQSNMQKSPWNREQCANSRQLCTCNAASEERNGAKEIEMERKRKKIDSWKSGVENSSAQTTFIGIKNIYRILFWWLFAATAVVMLLLLLAGSCASLWLWSATEMPCPLRHKIALHIVYMDIASTKIKKTHRENKFVRRLATDEINIICEKFSLCVLAGCASFLVSYLVALFNYRFVFFSHSIV